MEEYRKDAWVEIVERCQEAGVDAFECNFSCPHGLPERRMGSAMGENPEILRRGLPLGDGRGQGAGVGQDDAQRHAHRRPHAGRPAAGCQGISAINTIRSVIGVNLETLRPEPTVEGYTTPGGYSCKAVMPIALRMCMEVAKVIQRRVPRPHALGHRRHRDRQRRGPVHPAGLRHGAGLHAT